MVGFFDVVIFVLSNGREDDANAAVVRFGVVVRIGAVVVGAENVVPS